MIRVTSHDAEGFTDGVGYVDDDGKPLPVVNVSFYYGQPRLGTIWCELHDVAMGAEHCRCKP